MCGIAGIMRLGSGRSPTRPELAAMTSQMSHRGPDGTGYYCDGVIGLGHARLSIIDLEGGDQPISNEDGTVRVIFNGEIFNFIELRDELETLGHVFATNSDTEVIAHLYEERGIDFVHELNGQFAIALWDSRKRELLLVRDRPGIAPLYYARQNGRLLFGSEIKALLPLFEEAPRANLKALEQLMTFWAPVSPACIFEDVLEVSPGHMLRVREDKIEHTRYWDWPFPPDGAYRRGEERDLVEELHDLLVDATRLRLRSDVPVGAYLSGGLDSSVITALIHHHGEVPLRTFSIGFSDRSFDETAYQAQMISHLNAEHSAIHCRRGDIADRFLEAVWHTESPILRTAPVPMGILSSLVHDQGYRVVLTGEGSDEVLGGYDLFKETKIRQFWARHPDSSLRPLLLRRLYPYLDVSPSRAQAYMLRFFGQGLDAPLSPYFSHVPRMASTRGTKEFWCDRLRENLDTAVEERLASLLPASFRTWHPFNKAQYLEVKTLMPGYLLSSQGDRMLLWHSVEGRFPFLDHRVMEMACSLDPRLKMKGLCEKYILKQAAKRYLPPAVVRRHKQPYRAPDIPSFFSGPSRPWVEGLLSAGTLKSYGYFSPERVGMLVRKIRSGRAVGFKDNMALVGILSTQAWHHHFVEGHQNVVFKGAAAAAEEQPRMRN